MELRYKCGHNELVGIHKDTIVYLNLKYVCNECREIKVMSLFVTRVIGTHTLVFKRAQPKEQVWRTSGRGPRIMPSY